MKIAKSFLVLLLILSISVLTIACSNNSQEVQPNQPNDQQNSLKIYTTFYPLYDFTKKIVGDNAQVENLMPAGVEPHDFEPSPKQTAVIYDGDIFIFLGESMEPWAKKMAGDLDKKGVAVVEAGKGLIENNDPHIWLDPVLAKEMAQKIFDGVVAKDPEHSEVYQENLNNLMQKFDELDKNLNEIISSSPQKNIVTSHSFLGYVARRYGLDQVAITGLSPQEEPSPKKMAELVEFCKAKKIKYILDEPGEVSKLSQTLADEIGAEILIINPLGTLQPNEVKAGEDYFSVMEKNLEVLKRVLSYEQ